LDFLDRTGSGASSSRQKEREKVDYREVLSPEEFAVFARLREVRKEIAQSEAVPVYTIFTNEQLAQMVQTKAKTRTALEAIAGVGDARIEKYGARVLEVLAQLGDTVHEESGKPL
jgi:superfamily II DNA helicase RecQ